MQNTDQNEEPQQKNDSRVSTGKKKSKKKGLNFELFKSGLRKKKKKNNFEEKIEQKLDFENAEPSPNEIEKEEMRNKSKNEILDLDGSENSKQIEKNSKNSGSDLLDENSKNKIPNSENLEAKNEVVIEETEKSDLRIENEDQGSQTAEKEEGKKKKKKKKKKAFGFIKRKLKKKKKKESKDSSQINVTDQNLSHSKVSGSNQNKSTRNEKKQNSETQFEKSNDELKEADKQSLSIPEGNYLQDLDQPAKEQIEDKVPQSETEKLDFNSTPQLNFESQNDPQVEKKEEKETTTQLDIDDSQKILIPRQQMSHSPNGKKEEKSMSRLENETEIEPNLLEGSMNQTLENIRHNLEEGELQNRNLISAGQGGIIVAENLGHGENKSREQISGVNKNSSGNVNLLNLDQQAIQVPQNLEVSIFISKINHKHISRFLSFLDQIKF